MEAYLDGWIAIYVSHSSILVVGTRNTICLIIRNHQSPSAQSKVSGGCPKSENIRSSSDIGN